MTTERSQINIRLEPELRIALEEKADEEGLYLSEYIRRCCIAGVNGEIDITNRHQVLDSNGSKTFKQEIVNAVNLDLAEFINDRVGDLEVQIDKRLKEHSEKYLERIRKLEKMISHLESDCVSKQGLEDELQSFRNDIGI